MHERDAAAVHDLVHHYPGGAFRLEVPSLRIAAGEHVALVGASGSGKSTFLALLAGILAPSSGRVLRDGLDWSDCSEARRRLLRLRAIGLVFQEFALLDHLTVRENMLLPYFVHPGLRLDAAARERAADLARVAGLASALDRRPRALSHGERQRVALCRALVAAPTLVLADEPTGNLDRATAARAADLMLAETRRIGAALVVATHDAELAARMDRVVELGGAP